MVWVRTDSRLVAGLMIQMLLSFFAHWRVPLGVLISVSMYFAGTLELPPRLFVRFCPFDVACVCDLSLWAPRLRCFAMLCHVVPSGRGRLRRPHKSTKDSFGGHDFGTVFGSRFRLHLWGPPPLLWPFFGLRSSTTFRTQDGDRKQFSFLILKLT